MEFHTKDELTNLLQKHFSSQPLTVTFTQWEGDEEDEEVTTFHGRLIEFRITDNEFAAHDLLLHFQADEDDVVEILMEIPKVEGDLGTHEGGELRVFGTEAELVLSK